MIEKAKKNLRELLKDHEGFVGVGVGNDKIRVYTNGTSSVVDVIEDMKYVYEGYDIDIIQSDDGFSAIDS